MTADHKPTSPLALTAMAIALVPLLIRAAASLTTLPHWETDPLSDFSPSTGLTPALSISLDAVSLLGSALLLMLAQQQRPQPRLAAFALLTWLAVAATILFHGLWSPLADLNQLRIGAAWLSALAIGLALWHTAADRTLRAIFLAAIVGFIMLMVIKGAAQVVYEHAQVVESARKMGDQFIRQQGWEADSSMAKAYFRRLNQNEATAWFGLSNVFSSFSAAGFVLSTAITWSAWRLRREAHRVPAWSTPALLAASLSTLLCAAGIIMGGGKGGFIAAVAGLGILAVLAFLLRRKRRIPRPVHLGVASLTLVFSAIALIFTRGVIGERLAELSILFRAFYIQAATRIFTSSPLHGVGPDGFKDAYILAKNPLSPEEVSSPHSILFDWAACLGLAGLALGLLWLTWLYLAPARLLADHNAESATTEPSSSTASQSLATDSDADSDRTRLLIRIVCLTAAATVMGGLYIERPAITLPAAAVYLIGLLAWCGIASFTTLITLRDGFVKVGLVAAALALALHAQIEVTASWVQSCGLLMAIIGAAAAGSSSSQTTPSATPSIPSTTSRLISRPQSLLAAAIALVAFPLLILGVLPALKLEDRLFTAASSLKPLAEARGLIQALDNDPSIPPSAQRQILEDIASRLTTLGGSPVPPERSRLLITADALEPAAVAAAIDALLQAKADLPARTWDWRLDREIFRLRLLHAHHLLRSREPTAAASLARQTLFDLTAPSAPRGLASKAAWNVSAADAIISLQIPGVITPAARLAHLTASITADPANVSIHLKLVRFLRDQPGVTPDQPARLRAAAEAALQADRNMRLDADVRGLSGPQRAEIQALLAKP